MPKLKTSGDEVVAPIFGDSELILPEYFVMPMGKKGKYKLVNPTSQERSLSTRGKKKALKLTRKPVKNAVLVEDMSDPIPLELFSKKDRATIKNHYKLVEKYKNKAPKDVPQLQHTKPKERGRPEILPKNVAVNKARKEPPAPAPKKRGRPTKYESEEEKKQKKREQTLASNKRKRQERKEAKAKADAEGEGIISDVVGNIREFGLKKGLKETYKDQKHKVKAVLTGNITQLAPRLKQLLNSYGSTTIKGIEIGRSPVSGLLTGALSLFSGGKFGQRQKENDFDQLFHLFIIFTLEDGKRMLVEKNERINMELNPKKRPKTEVERVVNFPAGLDLNTIINKTKSSMGDKKFFGYSAKDNNCQDFIMGILNSNNIGDATDRKFVKQNTKELFRDLPYLRKLSNTLTDVGARANVFMEGGDINKLYEDEMNAIKNKKMNATLKGKKMRELQDRFIYMKGGMINDGFSTPPQSPRVSAQQISVIENAIRQGGTFSDLMTIINANSDGVSQMSLRNSLQNYLEGIPNAPLPVMMGRFDAIMNYFNDDGATDGEFSDLDEGFDNMDIGGNGFDSDDEEMEGTGVNEDDIDFDDIKWGSFTEQFNRFRNKHKKTSIKDLEDFAKMLLKDPKKYNKTTIKRARFYLNVLLPKKNKISGNSINMVKKLTKKQMKALEKETDGEGIYLSGVGGDGLYAGEGMYAGGDGMYAGSGCAMCGSGMEGGAIRHPILDEIDGGNIFKKAGRWFKKAGRTINREVFKPVDKAFSKGGIAEKLGRKAFREGVPVLTGALGGLAGSLAGGPAGSLAGSYGGAKGGEELVKMSGVGVKKRSAWIDQVKAVQKRDGCSYKEALTRASKERKN